MATEVINPDSLNSTPTSPPDSVSRELAGAIFATATLAFLGLFLETVLNVLFPALMTEFGIGTSDVQWMTSGYLLVVSVVMPLSGFLSRRYRATSLFTLAATAILVGALIAGLAPSYPILLAGRLLQGIGTGIATPLLFTTILEQAPRPKIGQLMGIGALVIGSAPAFGPILGGIVGTFSSWRVVFFAILPLIVVALVVGRRSIQQPVPVQRVRISIPGLLMLIVAFSGLVFGLERAGTALAAEGQDGSLLVAGIALGVGVCGVVAFVLIARRSSSPLIRLAVFAHSSYVWSLGAFTLFQFAALGLGYLIPTYAQLALGESPLQAGLLVLPGTILGAVLAPLGGLILDRLGARRPILIGAAIAVLGTVALAVFGRGIQPLPLAGFYFVFTAGFGLAYANTQTHGMSHIPRELTPDGTAVMNTLQQFFGAVSMTVLSTVLAISQKGTLVGAGDYASATAAGTHIGLIVIAVVVAAAALCEVRALRGRRNDAARQQ